LFWFRCVLGLQGCKPGFVWQDTVRIGIVRNVLAAVPARRTDWRRVGDLAHFIGQKGF